MFSLLLQEGYCSCSVSSISIMNFNLLADKKVIKLDEIQTFIIDECDRMLNMGFLADVKEISEFIQKCAFKPFVQVELTYFFFFRKHLPREELKPSNYSNLQTLLFSATLVPKIREFISYVMPPDHLELNLNKSMKVADGGKLKNYHAFFNTIFSGAYSLSCIFKEKVCTITLPFEEKRKNFPLESQSSHFHQDMSTSRST